MDNYKSKTQAELIAEIERLEKLNNSRKVKDVGGLLEKIAENYPNSYVSIIEKDLTISFASGQEFKKQGLDPNTFIGLSLEQVFAEHAPVVKKHYSKTFKGKEQRFELFFNEQYQLYKTLPLTNVSGDIDKILTVVENITERKQAEAKLKDSEEKFRSVFDNSPIGKSITGIDGSLQINQSFSDILGYSDKDLKTRKWQEITHPDDILKSTANVQDLLDGKYDKVKFEKRYIHKNGNTVWTELITTLNRDIYNEPEYFITSIQDITERKLSEQAIRENEVGYQELVDTINSGVAVYKVINDGKTGRDYIIQDFNKTALELEGMTKEQVLGKSLVDIRPNIDDYGLLPIFEEVWKTGEPGFFPSKEYSDTKYSNYYENRVFRLPNGNIVAVFSDVTERENTALLAKKNKERLDLALNATKEGIYDWNLISNEIYYSPPWKSMLGYADNELPNDFSIWEKLTMPEDVERSWEMQQELINKQRDRFEMEFKMMHKDGHWVDILSQAEAVFDKNGKAIRIVGTHADISERKKMENDLRLKDLVFESSLAANSTSDNDGAVTHVNSACLKTWGYDSVDEVKGIGLADFMKDIDKAQEILKSLHECGTWEGEFLGLKKNGTVFNAYGLSNIIKNEREEHVGFFSTVIDITKRKLAEDEIIKHREHLEDMVKERTKELEDKNKELERFNELFVNREFRIKELRDEIESLRSQ